MSWIEGVPCDCLGVPRTWSVVGGVWTCECGRQMKQSAIEAMQKVAGGIRLSPATLAMLDAEKAAVVATGEEHHG
ncbi:hypothetical protein FGG23_gp078 [Mycobacterium phage Ibhubesi]|uniref:Uncharacterized protein n=1 Tax=Mycobacterium phage Ibhubesi TaxID=2922205 RepID=G1D324_9CAUD|nr:hypothetical protein FGG23_gp078 [Mycobacterium phage Ibhubesi]AEK09174.1 hypothetical protein PBI_IBHUBESI_78 [Mycobacterium phage Ibhubesi]